MRTLAFQVIVHTPEQHGGELRTVGLMMQADSRHLVIDLMDHPGAARQILTRISELGFQLAPGQRMIFVARNGDDHHSLLAWGMSVVRSLEEAKATLMRAIPQAVA